MEFVIISGKTVLLYILIVIILRLMGKREIGELSILDLVVFIMLAEIAAISIENAKSNVLNTLVPMIVLLAIQLFTAAISLKSQRFRTIIDGRPSVLITNGQIDQKEMKRQRYNIDDLLMQLRDKNVKSVENVEFAILESSGNLSVFEKNNKGSSLLHFPFPLVMDGVVQQKQLEVIGKDEIWLQSELLNKGYGDIKDLFLCTLNEDGSLFINKKQK